MVAKAGLGLIGLSAIGVGGVALAKPGWLGMGEKPMPAYHSLASDNEYSSGGYDNKFGDKHKNYLVGVTNKGSGDAQTNNKSWWEWSFERLKRNTPTSTKFKYVKENDNGNAVKIPYATDGNSDTKALNQVCKAAYKEETSKITSTGSNTGEYKEADVWKYCSFLGEKPKAISEVQEDSNRYGTGNAIGKDSAYTSKLVSTTGNDKFWEIRDKEFKKEAGYGNIEDGTDLFFSTGKSKKIRDLCEDAYKLEASTDNESTNDKPKKEKVVKYCSLSKE